MTATALRNPETSETLTQALTDWVNSNHLPGLALQISSGDTPVYEYMRGDRGGTGRNDGDTLFGVASISKSLTSVAVLLLHQRGQLNIEGPVSRWIPELRLSGRADERIRIRDLLGHTSGLPGLSIVDGARTTSILADPDRDRLLITPPAVKEYAHVHTIRDLVAALSAANVRLIGEPGTVFNYSNEGYALLQGVVEAASGVDYRRFVTTQILDPLKVDRTAFTYDELSRFDKVADLYAPFRNSDETYSLSPRWWDVSDIYTNGSWKVTPNGLSAFARMLTHAARNDLSEYPVIVPDILRKMIGCPTTLPDRSTYGLGFVTGTLAGREWFGHEGSIKGVSSHYRCIPDQDLTIVVLINASEADPTGPSELATRIWLDLPEDSVLVAGSPEDQSHARTASELAEYVGTYSSRENNTVTIARAADQLTATVREAPTALRPVGDDVFSDPKQRTYAFIRDDQGTITGLFNSLRVFPRASASS